MVSLWYPTKSANGPRAQYMTPAESQALLEDGGLTDFPLDVLSTVRTNAVAEAKPAGHRHSLPLVVLSPGFSKPRKTLTALSEDLASNGYVVVAIDHTYESVATSFPDGRVATCLACEQNTNVEWWQNLEAGRARDVSFVLDELTGAHPKWRGADLIDASRIAMAGHSVGGASATAAMVADPRIRAGIDIDGTTEAEIPTTGIARPFMFLGKPVTYTPGSGRSEVATWERDWQRLTGWKRWLLVDGTVHTSFNDISVLVDQFGIDYGAEIPGTRSLDITRGYVRAFFELHLRDRPQPLLDGPTARYPEVAFCDPETNTCA